MSIKDKIKRIWNKICGLFAHMSVRIIFGISIITCFILLAICFFTEVTNKALIEALKSAVTITISMIGFSISAYVFLNNTLQRKATDNPSKVETIGKFLSTKRKVLSCLVVYSTIIVMAEIALLCFGIYGGTNADKIITSFYNAHNILNAPSEIFVIIFTLVCLFLTIVIIVSLACFDYSIIDYEKGLIETAKYELYILDEKNANNNSTMRKNDFLTIVNNMETVLERMAQNHQNALKQSANDSPVSMALRAGYEANDEGDYPSIGVRIHRDEIADKYSKIIEYRNYILQKEDANDNTEISISDMVAETANLIFQDCLIGEILSDISLNSLSIKNANLEKTVFRNCSLQHIVFEEKSILDGVDFRDSVLNDVDLSNADCQNINFSNARLIKVKLSPNTDLNNAIFQNADLSGLKNLGPAHNRGGYLCIKHADFSRANMINMNICNTVFDNSSMSNVKLYNSKIGDSSMHDNNTSFKFVDLKDAIMTNCIIARSNFENANLAKSTVAYSVINSVNLNECRFDSATFTESEIMNCTFEKTYCNNISLKGAKISNSDFKNSTMVAADFSNAELYNIKLNDSVCRDALFVGTNIKASSFKRCIMSNIRMVAEEKSVIESTNFEFTNLSNSSISNIEFKNCKFTGADFSCSRLINVRFVECEGIETIRFADVWMDTVVLGEYANKRDLRKAVRYCRNVIVGLEGTPMVDKILPDDNNYE